MTSELGFLIDLILDDALPKEIKARVASRIKEVEERYSQRPVQVQLSPPSFITPTGPQQAASTLAAMARHVAADPSLIIAPPPVMPPVPVVIEQIAQTPATAAAMNQRNETIAQAISGKVDKTTGRPRKW